MLKSADVIFSGTGKIVTQKRDICWALILKNVPAQSSARVRSCRTCLAKISNVRQRGKFSPDKMSVGRKKRKMSGEEITEYLILFQLFWDSIVWMLRMLCEGFCKFRGQKLWDNNNNFQQFPTPPLFYYLKCSGLGGREKVAGISILFSTDLEIYV